MHRNRKEQNRRVKEVSIFKRMVFILEKLTEREQHVRNVSIEYIKYKKIYDKAVRDYSEKKSWGILEHLLINEKEQIDLYFEKCLDLDISLGLSVEEGDKHKIPEYAEALRIG